VASGVAPAKTNAATFAAAPPPPAAQASR